MIQSKGGESIKGASIKDAELIEHACRVAEAVGIVGPANIQCFREPDGSLPVTDVNPRFGGAFPLPLAAGSRYPELALALANGERPEPRLGDFRAGVVMTRFFSHLCLTAEDGGSLVPFAEELPEPVAASPARRDSPHRGRSGPAGPGGGVRRQLRGGRPAGADGALHGRRRRSGGEAVPAPSAATPKQTKVLVTVVDGDTHRRVRGARVVIGHRAGYANTRGLASVKIKRRAALPVRVSKPGYGAEDRAACPSSSSGR